MSDYSAVNEIDALSWDLVKASDEKSSCAIPAYDLPYQMRELNSLYLHTVEQIERSKNSGYPEEFRLKHVEALEKPLNAQRVLVGRILERIEDSCI